MSTDWGIGCRDCAPPARVETSGGGRYRSLYRDREVKDPDAYFTGEWDNCRDVKALETLCAAASEILALHDKIGDLLFLGQSYYADHSMRSGFGGFCHGLAEFMTLHAGHRLAPMSEYRLFEDER
jgi:hypothetical protein